MFAVTSHVSAAAKNGTPFQALWDALGALQEQVTELASGGTEGPAGPQGEPGADGEGGGLGELYLRTSEHVILPPDSEKHGSLNVAAYCDIGDRIISGGHNLPRGGGVDIVMSVPAPNFSPSQAWNVYADNREEVEKSVIVFALCEDTNGDLPEPPPDDGGGEEF